MKQEELKDILEQHKLWLENKGGKCANLRDVDLRGADLRDANLCDANLRGVDLRYADLRGVDLRDANLCDADLRYADLRGVDLRGVDLSCADLRNANLHGANLCYANLRYADLDFSVLPLWCGGLDFKIDERIAKQIAYHLVNLMQTSDLDVNNIFKKKVFDWLKTSHLVTKHVQPILEEKK